MAVVAGHIGDSRMARIPTPRSLHTSEHKRRLLTYGVAVGDSNRHPFKWHVYTLADRLFRAVKSRTAVRQRMWSDGQGQRSLSGVGDQQIGLVEERVGVNSVLAREVSEK